jgi:DNA-directed RNA polymerase specialized sigma24 family protein
LLPSPAIPVGRSAVERPGSGRRSDRGRRGRRIARAADTKDPPLATRTELSEFLAGVERRAYKQALFAVRDDEGALDIVQDAMMRLAEKYGGKPAEELPLLFQRILQNAIRDFYRRRKVRSLWTTLFSALGGKREDDDSDPGNARGRGRSDTGEIAR